MKLQLVAVSGKWKGHSWSLDHAPVVIGRGDDVTVQVVHRTVSRRHCELLREKDGVRFRDLGSRNPALVNGAPARDCFLVAGDEVAVGPAVFLLAHSRASLPPEGRPGEAVDTSSWEDASPVDSTPGEEFGRGRVRPRTIDDLALLYGAAREFGRCSTTTELRDVLARLLAARFQPACCWLARVGGDGELLLDGAEVVRADESARPPVKQMQRALRLRQSLSAAEADAGREQSGHTMLLAAPVHFAGVDLGVLALYAALPPGGAMESEQVILTLLAQTLAPYLYALEDLEQLRRDNERLRARAGESTTLVGASRAMGHIRAQAARAAKTDLPVLITGETGTGKELVARTLQAQSSRHAKPFVVVNCAAIPRDLFESELFGHERGAYTGAIDTHPGLLEQADEGTLFLDEIGDLSLDNQARILRVIEYGTYRRVGAEAESRVNVRVISATNKDIHAAIRNGTFREDLYHRINAIEIHIPPLRERPSDIPLLARHFFEAGRAVAHHPLKDIAPDAMGYLVRCPWPGNVRQLRSCIQRAIALARGDVLQAADVMSPGLEQHDEAVGEVCLALAEVEQRHILAVLAACNGDIQRTARVLRVGRSTLYRKLREYGVKV